MSTPRATTHPPQPGHSKSPTQHSGVQAHTPQRMDGQSTNNRLPRLTGIYGMSSASAAAHRARAGEDLRRALRALTNDQDQFPDQPAYTTPLLQAPPAIPSSCAPLAFSSDPQPTRGAPPISLPLTNHSRPGSNHSRPGSHGSGASKPVSPIGFLGQVSD